MQSAACKLVILGTGGTIAGTAASAHDHVGYAAAQLDVAQLAAALPLPADVVIETEQVAQLDSKDMDAATWQALAQRCAVHIARGDVAGVVITHGTDTLEETAYLLHRLLAPGKPVVLTAAMRPATALLADGPQNLLDACSVACESGARGVLAVLAGKLFAGAELRKRHSYRLDAFDAGDAGPLGMIEQGRLRRWRDWPGGPALGVALVEADPRDWPRVDIVTSHAGSDGRIVDALLRDGVDGIVVAGCGNGYVHVRLRAALDRAAAQGVRVAVSTRCARGVVVGGNAPGAALTPVQARVELLLALLASRRDGR